MNDIRIEKTHESVTISASSFSLSDEVRFGALYPNGYGSLQLQVTGSGIVKAEYKISNNGISYETPAEDSDPIVEGFGVTSGPESNGVGMYRLSFMLCKFLKILITETGGSSPAVVSTWVAIQ